jgi:hypothetical protein
MGRQTLEDSSSKNVVGSQYMCSIARTHVYTVHVYVYESVKQSNIASFSFSLLPP